jgi:hypothetical protein
MKKLQRLSAATVFAFVLTSATFAGEISTPGIAQPAPSPSPTSSSAMTTGEIPIVEGSTTSEVDPSASNSLTGFALDLLQIMLTVF